MTRTTSIPVRISPRRLLVSTVVAGALVLGALPGTVLATWTPDSVTDSFGLSRPAVRTDGNGKTGIAYERSGKDPGIFFATDATGNWVTTRVASGSLLTPDLAFDAANKAHIVYADLGATPGIYEVTNATGSWVVTKLVDAGSPYAPSIAIDAGGKQHIAYSSVFSFEPGLYYLTDATGSWVNARLTTGMYDQEPSLAIDSGGKLHIAFARYLNESRGIHLLTNTTGSWVESRATTGSDDYPALVLDANDKNRIVFNRFDGTKGVYYTTDVGGPWATEQVAGGTVGVPTFDIESNGVIHVVARWYSPDPMSDGLYHFWGSGGGGWASTQFAIGEYEFPSLVIDGADQLRIAWRSTSSTAGIIYNAPPAVGLVVDHAQLDADPSLGVDADGKDHAGFDRSSDASGGTMYGTNATGSWATEQIPGLAEPPELALDGIGTAHIVSGNLYTTNSGGTWTNAALPTFGASEPALAVNPAGKAFVAYQVSDPIVSVDPGIHYATDASGSWVDTRLTTVAADTNPDIGLDSNQKAYVVYERSSRIWFRTNRTGSWSTAVQITSTTSHDPVIALDPSGKVHVAFRGAAGVYEVNNVSGSWTLTRLSRSYADGAPSLGIDTSGKVYVLFGRGSWAANPGIYLATNRSGSFALEQVSAESDFGAMSMAVLPGGLAHVLVDGPTGLMSLIQTDFLTSASTSAASRASRVDAPVGGGKGSDSSGSAGDHRTSAPAGTDSRTFTGAGGGVR
jgi:hypothetical protein